MERSSSRPASSLILSLMRYSITLRPLSPHLVSLPIFCLLLFIPMGAY